MGSQKLFFIAQEVSLAQVVPLSGLESHIIIVLYDPKVRSLCI